MEDLHDQFSFIGERWIEPWGFLNDRRLHFQIARTGDPGRFIEVSEYPIGIRRLQKSSIMSHELCQLHISL